MATISEALTIAIGHHQAGRRQAAEQIYRQILAVDPRHVDAIHLLGVMAHEAGQHEVAIEYIRQAIRLNETECLFHRNLGGVYRAAGRLTEAIDCFRRVLELTPNDAEPHNDLGMVFNDQGKHDDAVACFRRALELKPDFAEAHNNLGMVFHDQGKPDDAVACFRRALELKPDFVEAHNNLGATLHEQGKHDEAVACYRRALQLKPDSARVHNNLAKSCNALGRLDEAIVHYRKAVELDPANAVSHSNLVYALNYHPDSDAAMLFAEHRAWGERHADPLTAVSPPHANERSASRRLRVGYVSPHFKSHAVNFFSEPILATHDHADYEIFCYSDVKLPDDTTKRLRGYADHWRDIAWQSDQCVAQLIRADLIDILVDLTGHISGGKRLLAFARKPAPIQVTYIGYQNTTGMLAMDYRLTDEHSDPPGRTEQWHTENLVRLPRTFFCYLPSSDAPPVVARPAVLNGYVTFGSINNYAKITTPALATWAKLLLRVPDSRLLVRADMTNSLQKHLRETFAARGVAAERLELVNILPHQQYLELINRLDVALDPFPFNGHTTTCDCLWQGVPVVTLSGNTYVSRFGGSALATLGLDDLIAETRDQYIDIATRLAGDVQRLQTLRSTLRQRMSDSPLLDFETFTRNLECEYRRMWRRWLQVEN